MLFMIVLLFLISWLPSRAMDLLMKLRPEMFDDIQYDSPGHHALNGLSLAFHWLSMAHGCCNPLVYCFMYDDFRHDLQTLLMGRKPEIHLLGLSTGRTCSSNSPRTSQTSTILHFVSFDGGQPGNLSSSVEQVRRQQMAIRNGSAPDGIITKSFSLQVKEKDESRDAPAQR